ncbi:primase-helicase zinc-binding domain-containing protein [Cereibacter johrii]|uniref:primase-helicase zinc-binding domain-containing protein n=1 Tax=Cereibacter johrii TaxID=445629 RepID=UPI001F4796E7|nr:primase-helicase zinc-binding domain-containing protein [Cereibacter johrii]
MFHEKTTVAAKGKWRGILLELDMPEQFLRDKHGPCPLCRGKDRYRWDNKGGAGTYICSQCGAGDGMKLAMEFTGAPFPVLASRIDQIIRNVKLGEDKPRFELSDAERRRQLLEIWLASQVVRPGDLAHTYLETRGIEDTRLSGCAAFQPFDA